jgi:CheY-like chemotaxis protein
VKSPAINGDIDRALGRIRTYDTRFRKPMLYPLSYEGDEASIGESTHRISCAYTAQVPSVLIVDDDAVVQLLLRVNFEMDGFAVMTADDGEQGLKIAREQHPDLVLLDVMMPKMDGYEVLTALRGDASTRSLPIVLLSAKSEEEDRAIGMKAGADAYITKPFDPTSILTQVRPLVVAGGSAS